MRPYRFPLAALVVLLLPAAALAAPAERAGGPTPVPRSELPAVFPPPAVRLFGDRPAEAGRRRLLGEKAPAALDAVLVMCDFSDSLMLGRWGQVPGDFPPPQQDEIHYAAHDSLFFAHLLRDVGEYFRVVSGDAFDLRVTVHARTINLPRTMAWYGDHPEEGEQPIVLARDVLDSLAAEIDFSSYDTVFLVHAGAGEETDVLGNSPEQIYSTYLDPSDIREAIADTTLTGALPGGIEHVLVLPECEYQDPVPPYGNGMYGSLGVYSYEVGLRLGMLSLVDFTPAGNPDSQGIGTMGLMGYGLFVAAGWNPPHPCAFNKVFMGWQQPAVVAPDGGGFALTPAERTGEPGAVARIDIGPQEYWLVEYRLQDPDGNRFWSFGDDLNGNGRRDFVDASSADGIPAPGAKFDPAEDTREWLVGAEWDHFMTENGATIPGLGGGGSGVYVWHVNEAVIAEAFAAEANLFNSDPARKAVDLEEADGIQDLDSSASSRWFLGGDEDGFRGEGAAQFGPDTRPRTETTAGAPTGIRFRDFGRVVLDSTAFVVYVSADGDTLWGWSQADTVRFDLVRDATGGPVRHAARDLPAGVDLRGSHVLITDLDAAGSPAARREIVLADRAGGIWVADGDLNEYLDHDGDPETFVPFAQGVRNGEPIPWNLPAAVGDLDHDLAPEVVLTGPKGLYAFNADGTPVRDIEAGAVGLYADIGDCSLPVVLIGAASGATGDPATPVLAAVVVREGGRTQLRLLGGATAEQVVAHDLGAVVAAAPPVLAFARLWLAVSDTVAGTHALLACSTAPVMIPEDPAVLSFPLAAAPGPFPVAWGLESAAGPSRWVMVPDGDGGGETVFLDDELRVAAATLTWRAGGDLGSPLAPGGAVGGDGLFGRLTQAGDWQTGWPQRPRTSVGLAGPVTAPGALVLRVVGSAASFDDFLFTARDGRVFTFGMDGTAGAFGPLAGPGEVAGTPAVGQVAGEFDLDLVAVGAFPRALGAAVDGGQPPTEIHSAIVVWADAATGATWPMAGGSPWRNGDWNAEGWSAPPGAAAGDGIVSGSHICYPSPLTDGPLHVRAAARAPGRARVLIYNLEGEEVTASGWQPVAAREPFSLAVDLGRVASGMYLCRLVVEHDGGARDQSVVPFAVAR